MSRLIDSKIVFPYEYWHDQGGMIEKTISDISVKITDWESGVEYGRVSFDAQSSSDDCYYQHLIYKVSCYPQKRNFSNKLNCEWYIDWWICQGRNRSTVGTGVVLSGCETSISTPASQGWQERHSCDFDHPWSRQEDSRRLYAVWVSLRLLFPQNAGETWTDSAMEGMVGQVYVASVTRYSSRGSLCSRGTGYKYSGLGWVWSQMNGSAKTVIAFLSSYSYSHFILSVLPAWQIMRDIRAQRAKNPSGQMD